MLILQPAPAEHWWTCRRNIYHSRKALLQAAVVAANQAEVTLAAAFRYTTNMWHVPDVSVVLI